MKLIWAENHTGVILVAETKAQVAFAELLTAYLNAHRFTTVTKGTTIVKAKYMILPDDDDVL